MILDNYAAHKKDKGQRLARPSSTLDFPLHANLVFVAQCRRGLLCQTHAAQAQARYLPFPRRFSRPPSIASSVNTMPPTHNHSLSIRLTPMTATCRVPPLSRVKLGIGLEQRCRPAMPSNERKALNG